MKIVLAEQFESALMRSLSLHIAPDCSTHQYYMSLFRCRDRYIFERSGTFLVLSTQPILPSVDWTVRQGGGGSNPTEAALGLEHDFSDRS